MFRLSVGFHQTAFAHTKSPHKQASRQHSAIFFGVDGWCKSLHTVYRRSISQRYPRDQPRTAASAHCAFHLHPTISYPLTTALTSLRRTLLIPPPPRFGLAAVSFRPGSLRSLERQSRALTSHSALSLRLSLIQSSRHLYIDSAVVARTAYLHSLAIAQAVSRPHSSWLLLTP